ncbi:MAG: citrate:proton symporter [Propionibacteriaceae bacterium]|nr:citrate:proton symporter [Propionibacteriaceae bacterium]
MNVLAICGLVIVAGFMVLIMTKKATPFTSLVSVPIVVAVIAALIAGDGSINKIAGWAKDGLFGYVESTKDEAGVITAAKMVNGLVPTATMLLFAILFFGLMLTAGLFDPAVAFILKVVKGDPLKVLVGTAIMSLCVSVDGDGSTTTLVVCSALIPVYKKLNMKMMDLAVIIILGNSIMNLLPWGGPTARIIAALGVPEGDLLRRILPGMLIASVWVIIVGYIRGRAERKRLGIVEITAEDLREVQAQQHKDNDALRRPKLVWFNLGLTLVMLACLIFGGQWVIPSINSAVIFEVGFAIALIANYRSLKDQRAIVEEYGAAALHVVLMVLAAGVFMGILNGSGMSTAMGQALSNWMPDFLSHSWGLVVAILSVPGTFLLSNDAFYLGVLPVLNEVGVQNGFTNMDMAVASTVGQSYHLLSPLVGFIYLLLNLTGVDMGQWQRAAGKWALGTFAVFLVSAMIFGGMPFIV